MQHPIECATLAGRYRLIGIMEHPVFPGRALTKLDFAFSAACSAVATKTACAPFDRIRLLFQIQNMFRSPPPHATLSMAPSTPSHRPPSAAPVKYTNIAQALYTITQEEGMKGLWRGNLTNICRAAVVYVLKFGTNDYIKQATLSQHTAAARQSLLKPHTEPPVLRWHELLGAGAIAGIVQKAGSYPMDLLSVRVALGINTAVLGKRPFAGVFDCAGRIWASEGLTGFYKGFGPTLLTGIPYVMLQMSLFEVYKRNLMQAYHSLCHYTASDHTTARSKTPMSQIFVTSGLSGCLAGLSALIAVYPGDTVRKRMMNNGVNGTPRLYKHSWECAKQILLREGILNFYNGLWPTVLRTIPSGIIQFGVYELVKSLLKHF